MSHFQLLRSILVLDVRENGYFSAKDHKTLHLKSIKSIKFVSEHTHTQMKIEPGGTESIQSKGI